MNRERFTTGLGIGLAYVMFFVVGQLIVWGFALLFGFLFGLGR